MLAPVVTIDGPSAVGKSSVTKAVAERLGWNLLHSGSLYRQRALDLRQLAFSDTDTPYDELDLESEEVGALASQLSADLGVRKALLPLQRSARQAPGLVAEGRDMGTVVFPEAEVKIYLDAPTRERAERRYWQLQAKGDETEHHVILDDIEKRDQGDSTRQAAPLAIPHGAFVIDTSHVKLDEVVDIAVAHICQTLNIKEKVNG